MSKIERATARKSATPAPASKSSAAKLNRGPKYFVDGIFARDCVVLAQAITLVESTRPEDEEVALNILESCLPHSGKSVRTGITGVPGVGKSSVIEALGKYFITDRKENVAVLAIDPSSQLSGGSILGDKTRMQALAASEMAFIRPSPARGTAGGVARRTRETMLLCEAAGFTNIIVETVGVGQSETTVKGMVDFFLLLMITGAGDELQGIKRGIMELADLIAINKADGDNRTKADQTKAELQRALHAFPRSEAGWDPQVVTCSALTGDGIPQLWEFVLKHRALLQSNGWLNRLRQQQIKHWMHEEIDHRLRQTFRLDANIREQMAKMEREVLEGHITPFKAAKELIGIHSGAPKLRNRT